MRHTWVIKTQGVKSRFLGFFFMGSYLDLLLWRDLEIGETEMESRQKGFTLIEVLIVIVILAVLAGLAVPMYQNTVERSRKAEALQTLAAIRASEIRYYAQNSVFVGNGSCNQSGNPVAALDFDCRSSALSAGGQRLHFEYGAIAGFGIDPATNTWAARQGACLFYAGRNTVDTSQPNGSSVITMDERGNQKSTGVFA
jgi:prepilin-type N-terminal cleavage/methylation domain-containing protein